MVIFYNGSLKKLNGEGMMMGNRWKSSPLVLVWSRYSQRLKFARVCAERPDAWEEAPCATCALRARWCRCEGLRAADAVVGVVGVVILRYCLGRSCTYVGVGCYWGVWFIENHQP